jgi:hypothetical protein
MMRGDPHRRKDVKRSERSVVGDEARLHRKANKMKANKTPEYRRD